jgi:hypothetical protein
MNAIHSFASSLFLASHPGMLQSARRWRRGRRQRRPLLGASNPLRMGLGGFGGVYGGTSAPMGRMGGMGAP